jgi:hypothetical protein
MASLKSVFHPAHGSIKVMTLHISKGPEFPVVALVGAGRMPAEGADEREEARLQATGDIRYPSAGLQHPAQGADLLPEHSPGHRHGHGLHAPLKPALALLKAVNGFSQVVRHGWAVGLFSLGQRCLQQGQAQIHHGQIDDIAAEHPIVCLPV